jgi:hypothetical protein
VDERTRDEQSVYGELVSGLPLEPFWRTLRRGWQVVLLWQWRATCRFLVLKWWSKQTVERQLLTSR